MAETAYILNIAVRNKIATTIDPATVVNGNNDYTVVFDFDSEWDSLSSKTAMFVYGREEQKYKTVTFTGNSCVMPALYNTGYVLIGVFAGDIKTTSAAYVKCIPCIKDNDSTLDTGSGGTIDTGTTDHSQLINRDIADQHPISAITGLEENLTPLTGTTETLTPMQVYDAIKSGKSVVLQHTDSQFGLLTFASFNIFEEFVKAVVSTSIAKYEDAYLVGSLAGYAIRNTWVFNITEMAKADDIPVAVNNALAQAKANGEFDGADGLTPTIGENGNWYLGDADTGKPSRGDKGSDGKSAYQYAQDGGYTGTETEFAAKLAEEMPTALPNPNALTFTGAVEGSYDGSAPVSVEIPGGGSGGSDAWNLIEHITAEDAAISYEIPLQPGAKEYGIYWRYTNNDIPRRDIKVDESLALGFGLMFRCMTNEDLFLRVFKGPSNILVMSQNTAYTAVRFNNGGTYIGSGTDFPAMTLTTNIACTTSEIWVYWR